MSCCTFYTYVKLIKKAKRRQIFRPLGKADYCEKYQGILLLRNVVVGSEEGEICYVARETSTRNIFPNSMRRSLE